ncbi:hypothetical protein SLS56_007083 [Neofusicoccum ribis]|uniref:Zn(2)-C6 fungal-type domain-containing protein n=1 Tax=Neofusicoccum ribis TaxID=45134 RepID=A0ABR3SNW2_9PEZI
MTLNPYTPGPYRSRRTHRKSRSGCSNCKQRKIKCDEAKPQCWQCTKHSILCNFAVKASSTPSSSASPRAVTAANSTTHSPGTPPATPAHCFSHDDGDENLWWQHFSGKTYTPAGNPDTAVPPDLELNIADLELLHHFTVTTAQTLSISPELQTWWRIEVPRLAFSHPFVMRALLALSGIHLAHTLLHPGPNHAPADDAATALAHHHTLRALTQHRLALRTATSLLPSVTAASCAPLYVFAVLTLIISLAAAPDPVAGAADLLVVEDGLPAGWLRLSRGVRGITDGGHAWILANGLTAAVYTRLQPAARLRELAERRAAAERDGGVGVEAAASVMGAAVAELVAVRAWLRDGRGADGVGEVCLVAVEELMSIFEAWEMYGEDVLTMRAVFGWAISVDEGFLVALGRREARALVVFAFYGVLLHWVDGHWWVNGWGRRLVARVEELVEEGEEARRWLRWPVEQVELEKKDVMAVDCVVI